MNTNLPDFNSYFDPDNHLSSSDDTIDSEKKYTEYHSAKDLIEWLKKQINNGTPSQKEWSDKFQAIIEKIEILCSVNADMQTKVLNQKERIKYLEGVTNHADGTPLTRTKHELNTVKNDLFLLQSSYAQLKIRAEQAEDELALLRLNTIDLAVVDSLRSERDKLRKELDHLRNYESERRDHS
jgi:hypothetical protein